MELSESTTSKHPPRNMNKSASESELIKSMDTTPPNFVASRNKRRREAEDITSELVLFKGEIKAMIKSLFNEHKEEFKDIIPTLRDVQQTNLSIESSLSFLAAQNEELKKKVETLEIGRKEDRQYINLLEEKIEDLQKSHRKTNFEIKNVPKNINETKEDLIEMVAVLSKTIGGNLNKEDIKDIYRVRSKKDGDKNAPIIVETSSTILKTEILKASKMFNIKNKTKLCAKHLGFRTQVDSPIYISENLTPRGSRLHFLARDLAKSKSYKYCWTAYGKVYVRKDENSSIVTITNEAQVHQLLQGK